MRACIGALAAAVLALGALQQSDAQAIARTRVVIATELGEIVVELADDAAPTTVANFLRYVDAGQYAGGAFHRAVRLDNQNRSDVPIEVIQGGRARAFRGQGPLERTTDTGLVHQDGTISMARGTATDSGHSDFFICINDQPALDHGGARHPDGQGFAAFGRVIEGRDVVRAIQARPTERERLSAPVTILQMRRTE
ncbi:MAG: peptidylprolyl isomerase [Acidobacteria bacterium]|nr:peptidylprolyl isomerase [Acidobacteriota bacterium]